VGDLHEIASTITVLCTLLLHSPRCWTADGKTKDSEFLILGLCILLRVYHQSSSSTVRNCSLCFTLYYIIHTTCFGLTYRPSSGAINLKMAYK
jgi:hypothetical protein